MLSIGRYTGIVHFSICSTFPSGLVAQIFVSNLLIINDSRVPTYSLILFGHSIVICTATGNIRGFENTIQEMLAAYGPSKFRVVLGGIPHYPKNKSRR